MAGLGCACWVTSLFFDTPIKFILWAVGMFVYLIIPWLGKKNILSKAPLDTTYISERFGAFTIIILGQIIASVVFGLASAHWSPSSVFTSIMAFILAILIWGQYYRFTQIANYKCTLGAGQPYIYSHIPLIISLIIIGVCVEDFIKTPMIMHEKVNIFFCFSIILYLTSIYLLQYIAIRKFKTRGILYLGGVIATLFLSFSYPFSPMIMMSGMVIVFMILFGIQYWLGLEMNHLSRKD